MRTLPLLGLLATLVAATAARADTSAADLFSCDAHASSWSFVRKYIVLPAKLMRDYGAYKASEDEVTHCIHNPFSGWNTATVRYKYYQLSSPIIARCATVLVQSNPSDGASDYVVLSKDSDACHFTWLEREIRTIAAD